MTAAILAIDQSTSATKAILFDESGGVVDKTSRDHRQIYPQPGWVEHDAEEIWQNVLAVVREVAQKHDLSKLAGVSITNQRETVLVFETETGRPLGHAIVWLCRRGDALCQELRENGHQDRVRAKTGLRIDTYFSASKLTWLVENQPGLRDRLQKGTARIGTIDTYLAYRLTGGAVFATDHSNASRTLLFNIEKLDWDAELCELFSVPRKALPEVRESSAHFGETDVAGILPKRVPVVGIMGDSQASLFAQRCYQTGATKATFGTGTSVLMNIGGDFKLAGPSGVTALAWVLRGQPTYAFEGIISFSAATIAWLKNQLGLIGSESEVEALAESVPDSGGVVLVPAFSGLSAPHWAPEARAAILGMTAFTQREHVVRAALESIAYQIRDVLDMMRADAGVTLTRIFADGGPTRNAFLMQFTADITGVSLSVPEVAEFSALGAAMSGFLGLGRVNSLEELMQLPRGSREFAPRMPRDRAQQLYAGWLAAVKRVV